MMTGTGTASTGAISEPHGAERIPRRTTSPGFSFLKPEGRLLKPETAASMIVNQNAGLNEAFGIGFRVATGKFGKSCSARTFGHWGSTGTVAWADPATGLSMAFLTTKPAAESRKPVLIPICDAVSQAVL